MEPAVFPSPTVRQARRRSDDPKLDDERFKDLLADDDEKSGGGGIRCPRCGWQPRSGDRWMCICGHAWHTFDTRGRCPMCSHQWLDTQCLACGAWSPHDAWYTDQEDP